MSSNPNRQLYGRNALIAFYRGRASPGRPLLFLDFDGVLCYGRGYDSYNVNPLAPPVDLWVDESARILLAVVASHRPRVVITSSWQRVLDREQLAQLLRATGLSLVADALHSQHWAAPQADSESRHRAVERWLYAHYDGGPIAVLDDSLSGTGLRGSALDLAGGVVLCEPSRGLTADRIDELLAALG
ncbi:MAG TPA: HAD domain-containing protein [Rubrivivax sp.]|nr:HAD domain-containing protein [Rubrivivax sp.]